MVSLRVCIHIAENRLMLVAMTADGADAVCVKAVGLNVHYHSAVFAEFVVVVFVRIKIVARHVCMGVGSSRFRIAANGAGAVCTIGMQLRENFLAADLTTVDVHPIEPFWIVQVNNVLMVRLRKAAESAYTVGKAVRFYPSERFTADEAYRTVAESIGIPVGYMLVVRIHGTADRAVSAVIGMGLIAAFKGHAAHRADFAMPVVIGLPDIVEYVLMFGVARSVARSVT